MVGPTGPTSWPNGLPIFLMLSCFVVKQYIHSFGASFGGNALWMVQSEDGGGNGGDGGDRSDGWWSSGSHVSVFLPYTHVYICNTKIFYKTMK